MLLGRGVKADRAWGKDETLGPRPADLQLEQGVRCQESRHIQKRRSLKK